MSQSALTPQSLGRTAMALSSAVWVLLVAAAGAALTAWAVGDGVLQLLLLSVAVTLVSLTVLIPMIARRERRAQSAARGRVAAFIAHDASPSFTTDPEGRIGYQNAEAEQRFGACNGQTLVHALDDLFANPAAVLYRLQNRAMAVGAAREDVVTRRGHVRLSVHQIGEDGFLWRLEEMVDRAAGGRGAETLSLPMLTASKTGTILFMNEALRRIVGGRVRTLDRVFPHLPLRSGEETEVSGTDGPVRCLVAELEGASGRREIFLLPTAGDAARLPAAREGFEDLPVALVRLSASGRVEGANRLARELLSLPAHADGAESVAITELLEGPGRPLADWLAEAMAGTAENRPQVLRLRRREDDSYLQVSLRRVAEGGRPGLVAVLIDATELKSLEAQFTQSQKMQAVGHLAGGVAHDFNNLLTAISGHCDLLLLRHDRGDPDYADLVQIHQNANRAASLVRQLLAFSRKQTLKPEGFDLRDTLGELAHLLNRLVGEKVTLALAHDADLHPVRADRRQIEQVIVNLVVNARDAMPTGGEIRIETENRTLREKLCRDRATVPPGDYVLVRVRDEGEGIPPERREKVFEPFFTTKRAGEGTGLGLSTAYGIVKQTGGFIFVDSMPGSGTTFTLYLPASDARPDPAELRAPAGAMVLSAADRVAEDSADPGGATGAAREPADHVQNAAATQAHEPDVQDSALQDLVRHELAQHQSARHGSVLQNATLPRPVLRGAAAAPDAEDWQQPGVAGQTAAPNGHAEAPDGDGVILLVEDEAPVRAFAARALRLRGYTVIEAESAEQALEALKDPDLRVDLFLTDVVMPGMDGPSWVREALKDRPAARVVFVSGYAEDAFATGRAIPDAAFLAKPFSLSELAATVERQIH